MHVSNMNEIKENLKKKLSETTVIDNFKKLTSDIEKERLNGGVALLRHLNSIEGSDKNNSEFIHTLDRLIRGVGATRHTAKSGFYTVLVALLTKSPLVTIQNVLDSVKKNLSTAASKSEDSNISMGQILACGALIHSGKYEKGSPNEQNEILSMLLAAGKKRSYLSLAAFTFIAELIEKATEEQFKQIWDVLKPAIFKPWKEQTLDSIYLLVISRNKFPNVIKKKHILKVMDTQDIIAADSVKYISDILMNIGIVTSIKHPLYPEAAKLLVEKDLIKQFFTGLDNLFFKSNRNKQLIITHLLTLTLQNLNNASVIPDMLTTNYIKFTLIIFKNYRSNEKDEEFLFKMSNFFKILTLKLQQKDVESKTKLLVIEKLLFYPGTFIFEKITRTKIIQQITAGLDDEGVKNLAEMYKEVALGTKLKMINATQSESWINMDRIYAAQLVVKLLSHPSVQKDLDWRLEQLKFFFSNSLFKTEAEIGMEVASALKDCFYHSLDQKLAKLEDMRNILSSLIHFVHEKVFENKTELRNPMNEEIPAIWKEMMDLISKLESKKLKNNYAVPVFHTLVLHMGLQLFNEPDLAKNALKELQSCLTRLETDKSPKKRKLKEGELENDEPEWIEVVIDLFLSLLSHNSHLLRSIIGCVFPHLCPHLSLTALRQILDVLDPKNENNLLSKDSGSESDLSENESESSENESEEDDSENKLEEESDSELEENEDFEESATDRMRIAVREALHKSGYQTDDESEDMDNMDEEEGKKLDAALAEAFKMVKKGSKGRKNKQNKDEQSLTHFRVRVTDLIENYLDSEPVMSNCLEITAILLQTLEFSIRDIHQKPLENRIRSCLKKLSQIKKFSSVEGTTENSLITMLKFFLDKGSKSAFIFQDMGGVIADCCIFIIRCSQILNIQGDQISLILKESLETFFEKRDCLLPIVLFKNILQITWDGIWTLVPPLVNFAFSSDVRPFRRRQALELLRLFYCNSRFRTSNADKFKKKIKHIERNISEQTIQLLSCNPHENKLKEMFFSLLLKLLTCVKLANATHKIDWPKIGELVRNYRSCVSLSTDAKAAYNKFCRALQIPNLVKMQIQQTQNLQKTEESEESEAEQSEKSKDDKRLKKKRQKANSMKKDKQKAKKEARILRMEASSEGLEELNFASVNFSQIQEDERESKIKLEKVQENSNEEGQLKEKRRKNKKSKPVEYNGSEIQLNGSIKHEKSKKRQNMEPDDKSSKKKKSRTTLNI